MDPTSMIAFAAVVQAFTTVVLVIVTRRYVMLTGKLAKSAEEQIRLGTMPNLLFDVVGEKWEWRIINLGPHSAFIRVVHVELLSSDESVVGRGLLTTGEQILWGWNKVLGPNQEIPIVRDISLERLSGLMHLVFYFVYGPTGSRTHALDVKLRVETIGPANVHSQSIRLNEAPPELPPTSYDQIQSVTRA